MNHYHFNIRVFKAVDDPESSQKFLEEHTRVLTHFDVIKVTSANVGWMSNPNSYVIVVEDRETKEMVAGIRVHKDHKDYALPIQEAIWDKEPKIFSYIEKYSLNGTAEICGLWNSRKAKGLGLSYLLMKVSCSVLDQITVNSFLGLCSPFTLSYLEEVGFTIERSLGNNGTFYYPKEGLIATAIIIPDPYKFNYATKKNRKLILSMRNKRNNTIELMSNKGILNIKYELLYEEKNLTLNK